MGIRNLMVRGAQRAGDAIAKVSSLSPAQLEKIDADRKAYLTQMPSLNDEAATELTQRLLGACSVEIHNAFISQIDEIYAPVATNTEYGKPFDAGHNIRSFEVTKWVVDPEESTLDKLVNVYETLASSHCNIALIFNRTKKGVRVHFAVIDTNNSMDNVDVNGYCRRLRAALKGNFPGCTLSEENTAGRLGCIKSDAPYSVASVTNISAEKSEKFSTQTIEKLLDGIVPANRKEEYTIVLLATPALDVQQRKFNLTELYSALAPYRSWQTSFTYTESNATSSSATFNINAGISAGIQNGISASTATNTGEADSSTRATADTRGTSESNMTGSSKSTTGGVSFSQFGSATAGVGVPGGPNASVTAGASVSESISTTGSSSNSHTLGNSVSHAITNSLGRTISHGLTKTEGIMRSLNYGANFGAGFARSSSVTTTVGKNEGVVQTFTNYSIQHSLDLLESQMKRLEQASALGMWDFAAYVLSEDADIASNVAHTYLSLTQGEESYLSSAAVNYWRGDRGPLSVQAQTICSYLRDLRHPLFALNPEVLNERPDFNVYPAMVTATTILSGKELAYALNFPKRSVPGLPVVECAEFGRGISTYDEIDQDERTFRLGNIFHMHQKEDVKVRLSANSLSSHTFVTGSTGSGKTNIVCRILDEAVENGVPFLVIEPAKGEYKNVFGMEADVMVLGTNPYMAPLLHINPFRFPKNVHVLEHLDRLVEVFNACWPMYAAMPAVLKDAIERSYKDCGWDLTTSVNPYGPELYPSFADVARNVKAILDSSEYDAENKGAYKGSLLTRLHSLTNGINGMILSQEETDQAALFDGYTIVDLSRIGSSETKALLMGLLILKLQEHRASRATSMNAPLRHLTVLEEAHNLLRRTSTEQSNEGGNLLGKSVEMLANAIAEMRTYGEGFIIADQAPGLLDMSVIRNTNTKIIMRMPDLSDRELVGRAANLNDNQIAELARLPRGVAAVYQNEWIQPVLCKVEKAVDGSPFDYHPTDSAEKEPDAQDALMIAEILSKCTKISRSEEFVEVLAALNRLNLPAYIHVSVLKTVSNPPSKPRMTKVGPIISALFPTVHEAVINSHHKGNKPSEWNLSAESALQAYIQSQIDWRLCDFIVQAVITQYLHNELGNARVLQEWRRTL